MAVIRKPAPFDIPPEVRIARAQHRANLERIKCIPLHKLMADFCNPEKAYKHHRIIAEFGRRFIAFGRKYQLKSGRIVSCTLARNDGYFRTAEYAVDLPLDAIDWRTMYEALKIWEADRVAALHEAAKEAEELALKREQEKKEARRKYEAQRKEAKRLETREKEFQEEIKKAFAMLSPAQFEALTEKEKKAIERHAKQKVYERDFARRNKEKIKEYKKNHEEEIRKYQHEYWLKNKEVMSAQQRQYLITYSDKRRAYMRKYREAHREKFVEYERRRYAAKKLAREAQ